MKSTADNSKMFQLNIRITTELEQKIRARAGRSGRSITAEVLRMLERAEQLDEMLGVRADGAFDLAMCFSSGGAQLVIKELLNVHGVSIEDMIRWAQSGRPA
jgi:hypothetical protein